MGVFFMKEMWKTVNNFNNYKISNFGNVISNEKTDARNVLRKEKLLKIHDNGKGYKFIALTNSLERKKIYVHRLVAEHFIKQPINKTDLNHKDLDKSNNHFLNLEWCTKSENSIHAYKLGVLNIPKPKRNKVICIETKIIYNSILECAKQMNLKHGAICKVCNGKMRSTGGYHFKQITDREV